MSDLKVDLGDEYFIAKSVRQVGYLYPVQTNTKLKLGNKRSQLHVV